MTTLFISDLHLEDARPETTTLLRQFLRAEAPGADALYVLGDLFEAWVGDDDPSETGTLVAEGLRALSGAGTPVFFIHGNRDFLLGHEYAARCGMRLLPDPSVIVLNDEPVLIGHGDQLCSDDLAYQQFRAMTRDPRWRARFLSQPLSARLAFAEQARAASKARYGELQAAGGAETITDVTPATVDATFARHGLRRMIHGHTHRPAIHEEGGRTRIVLGDWYARGSMLRVSRRGHELLTL
ncbi:UDP-2,3-diacylglucosamine diphosphatase [Lysobacter pythonis]|uniref:UDP-2,3-diacylglucosamine hydrolase n=1 Tax=Solilutibacter pythonis TaxID=2483112 RepID=A0A3M2I1R6_9GAMM|nr:UDP-2,3-diacylglucosamine diphosphatase [Lysobacter pythonis]RMH93559.1 UDP-2,3-diacylglucosamine diphosphatase [Lysobacter pythonis]